MQFYNCIVLPKNCKRNIQHRGKRIHNNEGRLKCFDFVFWQKLLASGKTDHTNTKIIGSAKNFTAYKWVYETASKDSFFDRESRKGFRFTPKYSNKDAYKKLQWYLKINSSKINQISHYAMETRYFKISKDVFLIMNTG